jgi:hypothetical protein
VSAEEETHPHSPLYGHLPDCLKEPYHTIPPKQTTWKGILCPMIKDEIGFLSEWLAYYELHGFDKVIFFDNNSTTSMAEIEPWLKSGFAEIVPDGWANAEAPWLFKNPKKKFYDMMHVKYKSEVLCKEKAIALGYDIFLSVDTDEYVIPNNPNVTLMDDLKEWFETTTRGVMIMNKFQYNAAPHFMEPINLLTIEAYTTRTRAPGQMSYYLNVGKCKPNVSFFLSLVLLSYLLFVNVCQQLGKLVFNSTLKIIQNIRTIPCYI